MRAFLKKNQHVPIQLPAFAGRPSRISLRTNLLLWFLGISLVPVLTISVVGYNQALENRRDDIHHRLSANSDDRFVALEGYFADQTAALERQAQAVANREFFALLAADLEFSELAAEHWVHSKRWRSIVDEHGRDLQRELTSDLRDILLVDRSGRVLYSCSEGPLLGADLNTTDVSPDFKRVCRRVMHGAEPVFSGFTAFSESGGRPTGYLAKQVWDREGEPLGALLFELSAEALMQTVLAERLVGVSGRTALLNETRVVLTETPGDDGVRTAAAFTLSEPALAWIRHNLGQRESAEESTDHVDPVVEYRDAAGQEAFGILCIQRIHGVAMGVLTEVSSREALGEVKQLRVAFVILLAAVLLLVAAAGVLVSHRIAAPITTLGRVMQRVADGHRVRKLPAGGPHEIGRLAEQFRGMLQALNEVQASGERQYRLQRSQTELNERMRGEPDLATLAATVLEYVGDYYAAPVGAFFLSRPGGRLVLAANYGVDEDIGLVQEMRIGKGIVGQAVQRGRCAVVQDLSPDHLPVKTALGHSRPGSVIIAPFLLEGQAKGVLELGVFGEVNEEDLEFLRMCGESVALALDSARSRERVHRLLEETRRQAGVLSRQQKELQVTNAQLARSDHYKNEFLANMSHELRTPLNSMLIMSQILAENQEHNLSPDQVVAAETINKAGSDLLMIINDILDLSKVEAGKMEVHREPVDLSDLLKNTEALFRPMADEIDLEFRVEIGGDLPAAFESDPGRVNQILNNLLGNALKFTKAGSVVLSVYRPDAQEMSGMPNEAPDSWLAFSVADTGIGMSGEKMAQVFDAFNQGDGSIGRRFGGSGLGLSISRKLADLLGGQVRVESEVDRGSKFTLYLPLIGVPASAAEAVGADPAGEMRTDEREIVRPAAEPISAYRDDVDEAPPAATTRTDREPGSLLAGKRILLGDLDMRTVFSLMRDLKEQGAGVTLVRSWDELLAGLAAGPDLVLVDPAAFDRNPTEALARIRGNAVDDDILAAALTPPEFAGENSAWPHVLVKPVQLLDIVDILETIDGNGTAGAGAQAPAADEQTLEV